LIVTTFARLFALLPLAGALALTACGGGGASQSGSQSQLQQGIAVGEPSPSQQKPVNYTLLASDTASSVSTAKTVVALDQAAFATLWAEHNAFRSELPMPPLVDFKRQMVVGVFFGYAGACDRVGIRRVGTVDGALSIDYENSPNTNPAMSCVASVQVPVQFIAVERSEARVLSKLVTTQGLEMKTLARANQSLVATEGQKVVKDAASWNALWRTHAGAGSSAPAVDFSKKMVVAVFQGARPNGCNAIEITDAFRLNGAVHINYAETTPGPATMCIAAVVQSAHFVEVERSNEPFVFAPFTRVL
jgi:hypothetical protein